MKKNAIIIIALLVCTAFSAQAQFKYGIKAGLNINKPSLSADILSAENSTGFQVGPMAEFTVPVLGVGLDAAILYSREGMKIKNLEEVHFDNLLIPVNLKYKFTVLNVVGFYGAMGPYASFHLNDMKSEIKSKSFGAGLNFGIGVEFLGHLQVGVNYMLGLTDDYKSATAGSIAGEFFKGKQRGWTLSAAYLF